MMRTGSPAVLHDAVRDRAQERLPRPTLAVRGQDDGVDDQPLGRLNDGVARAAAVDHRDVGGDAPLLGVARNQGPQGVFHLRPLGVGELPLRPLVGVRRRGQDALVHVTELDDPAVRGEQGVRVRDGAVPHRRKVGGGEDGEDRRGRRLRDLLARPGNEDHRNPRRLVRDPLGDGRVTDATHPVPTLGADDQQIVGTAPRELEDLSRRLAPGRLDGEGRPARAWKDPDLQTQRRVRDRPPPRRRARRRSRGPVRPRRWNSSMAQ